MTTTPTIWQSEQQANTSDSGSGGDDQSEPKIVSLSNGNFIVLWTDNSDAGVGSPNGDDIIGQMYDALGVAIGSEFLATSAGLATNDEDSFSVAALENGEFVIAYRETNATGTKIRAVTWQTDSSAVTTSSTHIVHELTSTTVNLGGPIIAAGQGGDFLVSYRQENTTTSTVTTYTKLYDASSGWGSIQSAGSDVPSIGLDATNVAALNNGNYVVVSPYDDSSGTNAITYKIVDGTTGTPSAVTHYVGGTDSNGDTDKDASVAALSGGGFVVVWVNTDSFDTDVEFQIYQNDGTAVGGVGTAETGSSTDDDNEPQVIALADGGFTIVWDDDETGQNVIKGQRYDGTGTTVGAVFEVTDSNVEFAPTGTLLSDGRIAFAWETRSSTNADVEFGIWDPRDTSISGDATGEVITARRNENTIIDAGAGDDIVYGQEGDDTIDGGDGDDTLDGGAGSNTLSYASATSGVTIDLGVLTAQDTIGAGIDTITDFIDLTGSDYADTLNGDTQKNLINGGAGADIIHGGGGNDIIISGLGADTVDGGSGADIIDYTSSTNTQKINLITNVNTGGYAHGDVLTSIEYVLGSDTRGDDITGDTNTNYLYGNGADDKLRGHGGDDILSGGEGNDYLYGGTGADILAGGNGNDWAMYNSATGAVTIDLDIGGTGDRAQGDTYASIERIRGSIYDDFLYGNSESNKILGDIGNDTILGRGGKDNLRGGSGDDYLNGGNGNDGMRGDAGSDTYAFDLGSAHDFAIGFENDTDTLALDVDLWGGGLSEQEVVDTYMHSQSSTRFYFDFGGGDILHVLTDSSMTTADFYDDLIIV